MPVTEFAYFAVKPGKRVLDDSTPEGVIMTREWETACLQPGAHRAYWAMQIEDPTKLVGFLDWDRVEDHHDWLKTDWNAEVVKDMPTMLEFDGTEFVKHLALEPWPPTAILDAQNNGPLATEVLMLWFPADVTAEMKAAVEVQAKKFRATALDACPSIKGISSGWSVENDIPIIGGNGKVGTVYVLLVGWPNMETSQKVRQMEAFVGCISSLRGMHGLVTLNNMHVSCRSFESRK